MLNEEYGEARAFTQSGEPLYTPRVDDKTVEWLYLARAKPHHTHYRYAPHAKNGRALPCSVPACHTQCVRTDVLRIKPNAAETEARALRRMHSSRHLL